MAVLKLEWSEHKTLACEAITQAYRRGLYTDVNLSVEGRTIKCHRMILAHHSTYFRGIFSQKDTRDAPLIVLMGSPFEVVASLVSFIYCGSVTICRSQLLELRLLAERLGVTCLLNLGEPPLTQVPLCSPTSIINAAEALQEMKHGARIKHDASGNQLAYINQTTRANQAALINHSAFDNHGARVNFGLDVPQDFPNGYHTAPRHPERELSAGQPSEGTRPPSMAEDPMDMDTKHRRYRAAGCNNSPPGSIRSPLLHTHFLSTGSKKRRLSSDTETYSDERNASPSTSGLPDVYIRDDEEEGESEDSDGELLIDEGPEELKCEDPSYNNNSEEPQDLRVEPRVSSLPIYPTSISVAAVNSFIQSTADSKSKYLVPISSENPSVRRLYTSSGIHDVTIQPASSRSTPSTPGLLMDRKVAGHNNDASMLEVNGSSPRGSPNSANGIRSGKAPEKTYSLEQLNTAINAVIFEKAQPVEAINKYNIPRRTFFRHLKNKRNELGIEPKSRSKPSSRSGSPSRNVSSSTSAAAASTFNLNSIPTSGTHLHAMLKSITSASNKMSEATAETKKRFKVEMRMPETESRSGEESDSGASGSDTSDLIASSLQVQVKEESGDVEIS
ncbi:protein tramtrack, alpha isoform [Hyalella azteca]|uniref:Protein tramtrack, alpha isoform n=1 Tax=Hyalella azteca TaxID=294128 RepID=A0A8B7P626_HYAAZ|nr:protein tramtrack, alpha isoform [Hyalella azteca]